MAERHIIKSIKHAGRHLGSKANFRRPVTGRGFGIRQKCMGQYNVAFARGKDFPHMVCRRAIRIRQALDLALFLGVQALDLFLRNPWQQEHLRISKHHRGWFPPGSAQHIESCFVQQTAAACQPFGTVVVSRNGKNLHTQLPAKPIHSVIIQSYGCAGRDRSIVDISRNQHGIYVFLPDDSANFINKKALVFNQILFPGGSAQVPIGSMQKNHN